MSCVHQFDREVDQSTSGRTSPPGLFIIQITGRLVNPKSRRTGRFAITRKKIRDVLALPEVKLQA
jgi:hypothetical protein